MRTDMFLFDSGYVDFIGNTPSSLREAIDLSIAKWEFIRDQVKIGNDVLYDGGWESCGLCMLYHYNPHTGKFCVGCPVSAETGKNGCRDTPYDSFHGFHAQESCINIAQQEVDFLIALREKYCGDR